MDAKGCVGLLGSCVMLAACADQPAAPQQWNRWVCDNHTEVLWRPAGEGQLDLRLGGSDIAHRLSIKPSASGTLYSDPILAFHMKGEQGLVLRVGTQQLVGKNCKAP